MSKQQKGSALAFGVALVFIALEITLHVQTGIAGVFIAGMAGGLLIGDQMAKIPSAPK
jgi:hypothetical protein